ncbi:MAG: SH3 type 3 domain-containing protein, poly-gamma-glutamate synthesis protein (capsule biosynthesis protein) [Candidatus Gottesmanbacteria bacterium GW2011_GWA2_43_14]|uniref:SH3 type 3 domain-containing protein, poly-gamma-glutamate synthesis protein (Capsule biosynthesis protein) n=1 Tax=Candidatus Gottesmanbacteria bacterium GW2011_GWA2_43_14 TaxID=1618443 RepID=A0A0G1FRH0_9BACT|nr:MAG: SH3 type 3 domain-containing protein, poly-gamma-glutamate synthesis protein (capsule biosynthesis protein) [Candidatus Gottesmanbacteria bacterium GW2011_GWA2_43_14]
MQLLRLISTFILSFFNITAGPNIPPTPAVNPSPILAPITLEKIFDRYVDNRTLNQSISIITTGDVIPARTVNFKMSQNNDFTLPFHKTADFLKNSDMTIINLEAPLIADCPLTTEGMVFCGDQRFIDGLLFAGIDAATLGNNHSLNHGREGLSQSKRLLEQNNILFAGPTAVTSALSNLAVNEIKGLRIGILAYNILDNPDRQIILGEIRAAKAQVDFLMVSFHWGAEYVRYPANQTIRLAREAIDNGADFINGNHPHWIQPLEVYRDKLIVYAHGNFIFDQEWSEETKTGMLVKTYLVGSQIADAEVIPIFISGYNQPEILTGEKKEEVYNFVREISGQQKNFRDSAF